MCAVVTEKYIDPFTDFGFKWIFGTEENKSLLISFLNDLLELDEKIVDFSFDDLRLLENKKKISTTKDEKTYLTKVQLCDMDTKELFYDKMTYYYIEMPKFKKVEKELSSHLEKWLFYLKNLEKLDDIPKTFEDDEVLKNAFNVAEFLKLDKERKFAYQQDLKARLDYKNSIDYAKELAEREGLEKGIEQGLVKGLEQGIEQGIEQGLEQGKEEGLKQGLEQGREAGEKKKQLEIAKNLLDILDNKTIALKTELTVHEIELLR